MIRCLSTDFDRGFNIKVKVFVSLIQNLDDKKISAKGSRNDQVPIDLDKTVKPLNILQLCIAI